MKNSSIIFSVIIPFKGRFSYVKQAIASVLRQTVDLETVEILAINDAKGEEKTEKQLKNIFPHVRYLKNTDKEGPGGKRNIGIKYAKGEFVVFLDSDDQLRPDFLEEMSRNLEGKEKIGAVVCLSKKLYDGNFPLIEKFIRILLTLIQEVCLICIYFINKGFIFSSAFYLCQLSHMMFRKSLIENMRFNYDYRRGGEDWDFVFRVSQKKNVKLLLKRLIIFRYSLISSTYTKDNLLKKWQSYQLLVSRLPRKIKATVFYKLLLKYISFFER